jgi:hypothetical protein
MYGVLDLACDRLVQRDGTGMSTLNRARLLSFTVKTIHLQTIPFPSCLAISNHHLFLMALLDYLSVAHLLFTHFALSTIHHFPVATEVGWGVLRKMGVPKRG